MKILPGRTMSDLPTGTHLQTLSQTIQVLKDTSNVITCLLLITRVHILPMGKLLEDDAFQANPKFAVEVEIAVSTPNITMLTLHRSKRVLDN
jgi:hypothetical protein